MGDWNAKDGSQEIPGKFLVITYRTKYKEAKNLVISFEDFVKIILSLIK